jgi:hypothetical protein
LQVSVAQSQSPLKQSLLKVHSLPGLPSVHTEPPQANTAQSESKVHGIPTLPS